MEAVEHKIIFWGTPLFAVPTLKSLLDANFVRAVVTQPDKPQGRGHAIILPSPVKEVAFAAGVPVLQPERLDDAFIAELEKQGPATFLVLAYGKIIPDAVLAKSELPAINIHPSLLPDLRGPSPIQTALLRGYTQTGITLMQLDREMDHGPVIAQKKVIIVPDDTYATLSEKLSFMASQFLMKYVPRYLAGEIKAQVQDHTRATFSKMIKATDGALDLSEDASILSRKIKALNPWPGTWIVVGGKRLKILAATVSSKKPEKSYAKTPTGTLLVRCGTGSLDVSRVQLEGKPPMSAVAFLNGHAALLE